MYGIETRLAHSSRYIQAPLAAREARCSIVSIGSTSAHAGQPYLAPYVAAKACASLPMGKLGQVGEIAGFVVFLLSDRSGVVTGSRERVLASRSTVLHPAARL